ncbi:MAG: carboxypeptidase regulatory-like domain-containing protein, partial [Thermoplasmata archaeon]|nr:carboxypeptidase regulatory-like domain-containing protein [Thermoplasmata archaeon]
MINFTSPEPGEYSVEKEVEVTWEITSETIRSIYFRLEDEYNDLTDWIKIPNLEQRSMKLHLNRSTKFELMVEDLAGNVEYAEKYLRYDGTIPYLDLDPVHYSNTTSYYINYENDDVESGIENNYLSFDGTSWKEIGRERSYKLEDLVEGWNELFIRSVNYAGLSTTVSFELMVDLTPPVITSITPISGGYYNRELTRITWNVYDNMSGISGASIEYNDNNKISIDPHDRSYDVPFLLGGENRFKLYVRNGVGSSVVKEVVFYTDYKKPTIEWRYPIGEIEEWNGTIHVKFSEEIISSTLSIYIDDVDNTEFGDVIWLNNDTLLFVPTFLPMDNIDHSIKITGTDISGNGISDYKWFFINVSSTGAVTGRIIDEDGKPIIGVVIYIDDQVHFLDDNASFSIPLCDGLHRIEIRKEGFSTLRMDFDINNGGDK